jgi:hypothetical protein
MAGTGAQSRQDTADQEDASLLFPVESLLDCQFVEENAAGFVLSSLSIAEAQRVVQHLPWCQLCARLVHAERKTTDLLPFLSPPATPPATAKSALFDRIKSEQIAGAARQGSPIDESVRTVTIPASRIDLIAPDSAHSAARIGSNAVVAGSTAKRRFRWEMIAAPLAAVPLVLALAIVGGWALRTQGELRDQQDAAEASEHQNAQLLNEVTQLSSMLGSEQTKWTLSGSQADLGNSATGRLTTIGVERTWANLEVWNLPTANQAYQVLLETKDGKLHNVKDFLVDANGYANVKFDVSSPLSVYQAVRIRPATDAQNSTVSDTFTPADVLWMDFKATLGTQVGTEANANAK